MPSAWTFLPLSNGGFTLLDAADYDDVRDHRWYRARAGYVVRNLPGRGGGGERLHRRLLGLRPGDKRQADHINRDRVDNRRCNLRAVAQIENCQNLSPRTDGTSPHRGVSWVKGRGVWMARCRFDGRTHFLGEFDTEQAAADAAREFRENFVPFAED